MQHVLDGLARGMDTITDDVVLRTFIGTVYLNVVGYDIFADCPTMATIDGQEALFSVLSEHLAQAGAE